MDLSTDTLNDALAAKITVRAAGIIVYIGGVSLFALRSNRRVHTVC